MTMTKYDNGMNMTCYRYEYDYEQTRMPKANQVIKYDTLEIETDNNKSIFGFCFTYYFYYLKGKLVHSEIG